MPLSKWLARFRRPKDLPTATPKPRETQRPTGLPPLQCQHIVAIGSGKGGVGKSTVTTLLALAGVAQGWRVGVLDADVYGDSQAVLLDCSDQAKVIDRRIQPVVRQGIKFISVSTMMSGRAALVVRAPIAVKTIQQFLHQVDWGPLDLLLIDMPPGTGDIQLSIAQKIALSGAVVVTTPPSLAVTIAEKSIDMFQRVDVPILGIIENMSGFQCDTCHTTHAIFEGNGGVQLAANHALPLLAQLPVLPRMLQQAHGLSWSVLGEALGKTLSQALLRITTAIRENEESLANQPQEISITDHGATLMLQLPQGEARCISAYDLRCRCCCALCRDELTGEQRLDTSRVPKDIMLTAVKQVGRYGFGARFSDGHTTGIYRFRQLSDQASELA